MFSIWAITHSSGHRRKGIRDYAARNKDLHSKRDRHARHHEAYSRSGRRCRDRILATGTLAELKTAAGQQKYSVDNTFAEKVIVPGFVAQHDHPVLTALTMASEVLSIEDWVLPSGTIPAVKDKQDFFTRLIAAEKN